MRRHERRLINIISQPEFSNKLRAQAALDLAQEVLARNSVKETKQQTAQKRRLPNSSADLGSKIRKSRELQHMSQVTLGYLVGVSGATISGWEANKRVPNLFQRTMLKGVFPDLAGHLDKATAEISSLLFGRNGQRKNGVKRSKKMPRIGDRIEDILSYF